MISCCTKTSLHTEQCNPSVNPVDIHVGTTASSTTTA